MKRIISPASTMSIAGLMEKGLEPVYRGAMSKPGKPHRRQITDADKQAAERLRGIYQAKKGELGLTQDKIGELYGEASQGLISQYMNGRIALGPVATLKFSRIFRVAPTDIRPDFQWSVLPGDLPPDVIEMAIKIASLPREVREDIAKTVDALSGSAYAVMLHNFVRSKKTAKSE